jgi:hypothetical protein
VANSKASELPVTREILRYFLSHPEAADSLTEIVRWRLTQETIRRTAEDALMALNWLLAAGYVEEEIRAGTERMYRLNAAHRKEAESFLRHGAPHTQGPDEETHR